MTVLSDVSSRGFSDQSARAKNDFAHLGENKSFQTDVKPPSMKDAVRKGDKKVFAQVLGETHFDEFAKEAYASSEGYAIRVNPLTGEKEMFVAGTKDLKQWGLNLVDTIATNIQPTGIGNQAINEAIFGNFKLPTIMEALDPYRGQSTKRFEQVARDNGIQVIYGHSRGGAIVADMKVPGATKVGLDAAMIMTHNRDMLNLNEFGTGAFGQAFDGLIGLKGQKNMAFDLSSRHIHGVWKT